MRRPKSEDHKRKLRAANLRPETRARLSIINKGKTVSTVTRQKQSVAMKGRPSSRKGIPMSPESKKKLSESQKKRLANQNEQF
jgi:hypothetical protein